MRKTFSALASLLMLGSVVAAGALKLSLWILPVFFGIFVLASVYQRWPGLRSMAAMMPAPLVMANGLAMIAVQAVIVALLYFIPYAIAVAATGTTTVPPVMGDREAIAAVTAAIGAVILLLAYRPAAFVSPSLPGMANGGAGMSGPASGPKAVRPPIPSVAEPVVPDTYERLMDDLQDVAESDIVMPVRLYELARRFASMPDVGRTLDMFRTTLVFDENMHLRRIVQMTLRFFDQPGFDVAAVSDLVVAGLRDSEDWVKYDALRAADVLGCDDPSFREIFSTLADGMEPPPLDARLPANDAALQMRVRAARLLQKLTAA